MITLILIGLNSLIIGIFLGVKINKWSQKINEEIAHKKNLKVSNEIFLNLLSNLKNGKTKFKTRVNDQVYLSTKLQQLGKVEVVYLISKSEIGIFQNQTCVLNSQFIEKETISELINLINQVYQHKINDIIQIFGFIFDRNTIEKTFNIDIEEIKKQTLETLNSNQNEIDKIIHKNDEKFNVDEILDKINKVGLENLTKEEKQFLDNLNKK